MIQKRKVCRSEILGFVKKFGFAYFEISARDYEDVREVFFFLTKCVIEKNYQVSRKDKIIKINTKFFAKKNFKKKNGN